MFKLENLEKALENKNWSRYRLSKESGVSQTTLRDIFGTKKVTPTTNTLSKIAKALDVPISDFFDDNQPKKERDYSLTTKEQENIDIEAKKIIDELSLSFSKNKDTLTDEDYFAIENALRITLESIKIKNKKKFTPKKYK
jgi:transcriptional regulator with XRE-family HTH domain